jgi:hypothetical protein
MQSALKLQRANNKNGSNLQQAQLRGGNLWRRGETERDDDDDDDAEV